MICGKWLGITETGRNRMYWLPCGEASHQIARFEGMGYHTAVSGERTAETHPHNSLFHSADHVPRYYQWNILFRTALSLSISNRNIYRYVSKWYIHVDQDEGHQEHQEASTSRSDFCNKPSCPWLWGLRLRVLVNTTTSWAHVQCSIEKLFEG